MKVSAALSTCIAPLALAKSIDNVQVRSEKESRGLGIAGIGENSVLGSVDQFEGLGLKGFGIQKDVLSDVIILWVNPGANAATTVVNTVTQTVVAGGGAETAPPAVQTAAGTAAAAGAGATHTVTVGGAAAGLAFTPAEVKAAIGDTVIFSFLSMNHSATQSAFMTPCDPMEGGMDSGFQPNPNNSVNPPPQVAMQVMVDTPLWFYCKQMGHCGKGMTFSINPTADKTQAMFQSMAISQKGMGGGSAITGGESAPPAGSAVSSAASAAGGSADAAATADAGSASSATLGTGDAAAATPASNLVPGAGSLNADGSCSCAVVCGAGSFPAVAQGNGAFGGLAGAIPSTMIGV